MPELLPSPGFWGPWVSALHNSSCLDGSKISGSPRWVFPWLVGCTKCQAEAARFLGESLTRSRHPGLLARSSLSQFHYPHPNPPYKLLSPGSTEPRPLPEAPSNFLEGVSL